MNRFERPQQLNQSKQALSQMLRARLPINQFIGPGPGNQNPAPAGPQAGAYPPMQRQFSRQTMRPQHPANMQQNQVCGNKFSFPVLS